MMIFIRYTVCNQTLPPTSQPSPHIKLDPSSNQDYDHNLLVFIIAPGSGNVLCLRAAKLGQDAKTFLQKSNKAGKQCGKRVLAKGSGAYVGNEMLPVSDSKRAYQLAFPHSLSLHTLLFISFLSAATQELQAALWEKYLPFIFIIFTLPLYS